MGWKLTRSYALGLWSKEMHGWRFSWINARIYSPAHHDRWHLSNGALFRDRISSAYKRRRIFRFLDFLVFLNESKCSLYPLLFVEQSLRRTFNPSLYTISDYVRGCHPWHPEILHVTGFSKRKSFYSVE